MRLPYFTSGIVPTVGAEEAKLITEAPDVVSAPETFSGASDGLPNDARSIDSPEDDPSVRADVVNCVSSPPATVTPRVDEALSVTAPAPSFVSEPFPDITPA